MGCVTCDGGCNRSAEQSTEMFRSLRSVAMQLDQGLLEMEELDGLLQDDDDAHSGLLQDDDHAPSYHTPAMTGPANVEPEPQVCVRVGVRVREKWKI